MNSASRRAVLRCTSSRDVKALGGKQGSEQALGLTRSLGAFIEQLKDPLAKFESQVETMQLRIELEKSQDAKRQKTS